MFVIFSGVSGVGKNTIMVELMKRNKNVVMFKTCTTRQKRENEGDNYYYLTKEQFEQNIKDNKMFEYELVHNNYYGTLKSSLEEITDATKIFVKDFDVNGKESFCNKYSKKIKIISIFLTAPYEVLKQRLIERNEKDIDLRLSRGEYEISKSSNYDYVIENIDLSKTVEIIEKIIEKNQQK